MTQLIDLLDWFKDILHTVTTAESTADRKGTERYQAAKEAQLVEQYEKQAKYVTIPYPI